MPFEYKRRILLTILSFHADPDSFHHAVVKILLFIQNVLAVFVFRFSASLPLDLLATSVARHVSVDCSSPIYRYRRQYHQCCWRSNPTGHDAKGEGYCRFSSGIKLSAAVVSSTQNDFGCLTLTSAGIKCRMRLACLGILPLGYSKHWGLNGASFLRVTDPTSKMPFVQCYGERHCVEQP